MALAVMSMVLAGLLIIDFYSGFDQRFPDTLSPTVTPNDKLLPPVRTWGKGWSIRMHRAKMAWFLGRFAHFRVRGLTISLPNGEAERYRICPSNTLYWNTRLGRHQVLPFLIS